MPHPLPAPASPRAPGAAGESGRGAGARHGPPALHQVPALRLQLRLLGLYVLVGAGALMMTVGFFGCCGAVRESECLLGAFFACLLVIFAAEVTAGVFAFIGKKAAVQEVQTIYEEAYKDYVMDMGKSNKTLIQFHTALQCCGKESEVQVKPTCPEGIQVPKNCLDEIQNLINSNLHLVGIVGIGIAGITIFGMIFSMVLCCAIRNTRDML
ncbi:tetraspanin-2 isoform X2 [Lepidochelys kempii]|uniref:tetraspanin-2 isoform X2 n=1 Tax=Lepidochelys kempii TaxID=8472 RepID=UPI003C6EEC41